MTPAVTFDGLDEDPSDPEFLVYALGTRFPWSYTITCPGAQQFPDIWNTASMKPTFKPFEVKFPYGPPKRHRTLPGAVRAIKRYEAEE